MVRKFNVIETLCFKCAVLDMHVKMTELVQEVKIQIVSCKDMPKNFMFSLSSRLRILRLE